MTPLQKTRTIPLSKTTMDLFSPNPLVNTVYLSRKYCCPQIIPGASQLNSFAAFIHVLNMPGGYSCDEDFQFEFLKIQR